MKMTYKTLINEQEKALKLTEEILTIQKELIKSLRKQIKLK